MPSTKLLRGLAPFASKPARSASFRPATTCLRLPQPGAGAVAAPRQAHTAARSALSPITARPRLPGSPLSTPQARRTIFIQTESTPNADALKFLPNHRVLPESVATPFIEYMSPRSTIAPPYPSPLAAQLMAIDGVTSVFYGADFITVTKSADANWAHIRPEIFALITEAVTSGQPLVNVVERGADGEEGQSSADNDSLRYDESDSEVVGMIKELLETRIRPAIQEDGGDIEYCGFDDGFVKLKLRGACRTCDSSTVTLKNGIEGMLMHYVSLLSPLPTSSAQGRD
jgi:Fe-S cluster biogenesis protein NfuA